MNALYISVIYHTIMLNYIENILYHFEFYFSRKATFLWFVAITIGFMLRSDKLGVTSVIRNLALYSNYYDFFAVFLGHLPSNLRIYASASFRP